jgi:hypothetical protein
MRSCRKLPVIVDTSATDRGGRGDRRATPAPIALAVPGGTTLRLGTQAFWPKDLLQRARILVHGYFAP